LEPIARFVPDADGIYRALNHDLPPPTKQTMPADWANCFGGDFFGRVRYHRVFQWLGGLESGERAFLVVEPPRSEGCILLAGQLLGFVFPGEPAGRFDITNQLQYDNHLEVFVDHPALNEMRSKVGDPTKLLPGGLVGEVRLEIEE
jgi:hypothetical protein